MSFIDSGEVILRRVKVKSKERTGVVLYFEILNIQQVSEIFWKIGLYDIIVMTIPIINKIILRRSDVSTTF